MDEEERSQRTMLLQDLRDLFQRKKTDRLRSRTICRELQKLDHRPWAEWTYRGDGITPRGLADLLRPFGVKSKKLWIDDASVRGYSLEELSEAFTRYLEDKQAEGSEGP